MPRPPPAACLASDVFSRSVRCDDIRQTYLYYSPTKDTALPVSLQPPRIWGPDTASTSAFAVVNSASTTEFTVYDTGNATLAGSLVQSSDQRLKTNIQGLDASSSLAAIDALNPVTFNWIDPSEGATPQLGFIAQQVQSVFPKSRIDCVGYGTNSWRHTRPQLHRAYLPNRRCDSSSSTGRSLRSHQPSPICRALRFRHTRR